MFSICLKEIVFSHTLGLQVRFHKNINAAPVFNSLKQTYLFPTQHGKCMIPAKDTATSKNCQECLYLCSHKFKSTFPLKHCITLLFGISILYTSSTFLIVLLIISAINFKLIIFLSITDYFSSDKTEND